MPVAHLPWVRPQELEKFTLSAYWRRMSKLISERGHETESLGSKDIQKRRSHEIPPKLEKFFFGGSGFAMPVDFRVFFRAQIGSHAAHISISRLERKHHCLAPVAAGIPRLALSAADRFSALNRSPLLLRQAGRKCRRNRHFVPHFGHEE